MKRGTKNSVLVELEKISDDEYQLGSGVKLFINTTYKPEQHQRIYGTCVAIPEMLTKGDQIKFEEGDYRFTDSIEPEVKVGDRVYFTYLVVRKENLVEYEGKSYYNIPYSQILCVVRDVPAGFMVDVPELLDYSKKENKTFESTLAEVMETGVDVPSYKKMPERDVIIPIGGNILLEEYYGKDAEMIEVNGFKIHVENSKSSTLITNIVQKPSRREGIVRIIGTPLKGDEIEFSTGDIVMFPNKFGFKNNIEGTDYLFVKYWDIQAIVGQEV
jgi:co-chaperonin GroES (HSP10)